MFDKMIFNAEITSSVDIPTIVARNHLQLCNKGKKPYYESSEYSKLEGIYIKVEGNTVQIKCSLHKLYYKGLSGKLDNSLMFTVSDALDTITAIFNRLGIDKRTVKVTYFEIGLNLPMQYDPAEYIGIVKSIGGNADKELFNDANFQKNRQKTTEKSRNIRKVFKIYDKSFEARSKRRTVDDNILRIETVYRRQSIQLSAFVDKDHIEKITGCFFRDWNSVEYPQRIDADVGVRSSQIEKARCILELGRETYLKQGRDSFLCDNLSKMKWETIRAFVSGWDSIKDKFRFIPDNKEVEYKNNLEQTFKKAVV